MRKHSVYVCLSTTLAMMTSPTFATPIQAVIGLNNSQVQENSHSLSLTANTGTILPLSKDFSPITGLQGSTNSHWLNEIEKTVRVEHKHRDLTFEGTLASINQSNQSFRLNIKDTALTLPMNDFYLIPQTPDAPSTSKTTERSPISYQTNDLSWRPQLSLIFDQDQVTVTQQALLSNQSNHAIELENSLLHYSNHNTPRILKSERAVMAMNDASPAVQYQNSEISYPLGETTITLAPYSSTLIPLPSSQSKIDQHVHTANVSTYYTRSDKMDLRFFNKVTFSLQNDGFPGQYRTFWKQDDLLIPGNTVSLDKVRANTVIDVTTNQSQDLSGTLTLVSATSQSLPTTQVWEAKIENHSNRTQQFAVDQNTNGLITLLKEDLRETSSHIAKTNARGLMLTGQIPAHTTKTFSYTIELEK
ncbi:hypothetical protein [Marinomonas algarum]|uniref:DUF4139 domain-containing protein n=1 Tax=Marinomonas algarum TaxID=2883105 RepID=A0A9X1IK08_9GAMM|nr:hypothetical protein [Marinomonas algarum]MCB5160680.1 hypothetical protein [Marinomonas algarum]